jgi:nuclear GTP-binding protein
MATRCKNIEHKILGMQGEKKIILLLNKIDLVPIDNAYAWQNYLRR